MSCSETFTLLNNINPRVVGRSFWRTVHSIAAHIPKYGTQDYFDREKYFIDFAYSICKLFPCESCRSHCQFDIRPEDAVKDQQKYNCMFLTLHNNVRERQGRAPLTPKDIEDFIFKDKLPPESARKSRKMKKRTTETDYGTDADVVDVNMTYDEDGDPNGAETDSDLSGGEIAGIVIACIVVVVAVVCVIVYYKKQNKNKSKGYEMIEDTNIGSIGTGMQDDEY